MKILSNEEALHYQFASLQRGHCVFTSFCGLKGKILFLDAHLERLLLGADFLFPAVGWAQKVQKIKKYVEEEFANLPEDMQSGCYGRLNIFDDNIFLQLKKSHTFSDSLKLTMAKKIKTPGLCPTFLKLPNYVEADLELARAQAHNFDDVVFFDHMKNITEATTSNIIMVAKNGSIVSPAPSSIVLDGILRKKLFLKLKDYGYNMLEQSIGKADLLNASEIWLTNSIRGIRRVSLFEGKSMDESAVYQKVVQIFGRYGEMYE